MNVFIRSFRRLRRRGLQNEIEEELQFHLDLLTEEHCRPDIPWEQARAAALKRFGNVEQITDECVRIARRNQPVVVGLKWLFGFVFVTGVLISVFGIETGVVRVGHVLMQVGVFGRLLLYVRGIDPSKYVKRHHDPAPLKLNDPQLSFAAFDQKGRTPVERVISSK